MLLFQKTDTLNYQLHVSILELGVEQNRYTEVGIDLTRFIYQDKTRQVASKREFSPKDIGTGGTTLLFTYYRNKYTS